MNKELLELREDVIDNYNKANTAMFAQSLVFYEMKLKEQAKIEMLMEIYDDEQFWKEPLECIKKYINK